MHLRRIRLRSGLSASVRRDLLGHAGTLLVFAFGVAVSLHFGRRGFMPLDQSIVFDGGWRILSGQVPYRDYVAPGGVLVHALQAGFFALFGVTWLAYCLHAALVNGLFAVLVERTLAALGLTAPLCLVYGGLSALVLYPPFGVPYMDPHAFFFSLLAVWMAIRAGRDASGARASTLLWLLVPGVLVLAALSKQIPSAFVVPIVLGITLRAGRRERHRRLRLLAAGSGLAVLLLVLLAGAAGVRADLVGTYLLRLPAEEAARRYAQHPGIAGVLGLALANGVEVDLWSIALVQGAFVLAVVAWAWLRTSRPGALAGGTRALVRIVLAEAVLGVCLAFTVATLNQPALGVGYVFLAVGCVHAGLEQGARAGPASGRLARAARLAGALLLVVALRDGLHFTAAFDASRAADDLRWNPAVAARNAADLPPALAFLRWQTSPFVPYRAADLRALVDLVSARQQRFLLIGDASIVYGLTGMPSASPSLWFHRGLTIPLADDPAFPAWEQMLLERVDALDVRLVVLEGHNTWNRVALSDFPRLARLVRRRRTGLVRLGGFTVIELGPREAVATPRRRSTPLDTP